MAKAPAKAPAKAAAKAEVQEAPVKEAVVASVEAQPELPLSYSVTLKGQGLLHGGVNGRPFTLKRGEAVIVSPEMYYVLRDADEIE